MGINSYSNLIPYTGEIDILLTPLNQVYDATNLGFVMGYFSPGDTFTTASYSRSNERNDMVK